MKRWFEAGGAIPSPQQPIQDSRLSAHPSRAHSLPQILRRIWNQPNRYEQQLPQRLADAAEEILRPHLDYNALLATTRDELMGAKFVIPKDRPFTDLSSRVIVGIGSDNSIKEGEMRARLKPHRAFIERVGEAEEDHRLITEHDATSKAEDAARYIEQGATLRRRVIRTREYVTLATDVLNAVPTIAEDPDTHQQTLRFKRLGKPGTLEGKDPVESVHDTFKNLAELARTHNWETIPYLVEIATVIHSPNPIYQENGVSIQRSAIFLSREGVQRLATDEGFASYQRELQLRRFNITKIAGGLELDVLDAMGLVIHITGTPSDIETKRFTPQRPQAKEHAYRIALGHADERLIGTYFGNTNEPNSGEEHAIE